MEAYYFIHVTDTSLRSDNDTRVVEVKRSEFFSVKSNCLAMHVPFTENCRVSFDSKDCRVIHRDLFYRV